MQTRPTFSRRQTTQEWHKQTCDYDLNLVTLVYKHDLDTPKMRTNTKNKLSRSRLLKVRALPTGRHTNEQESYRIAGANKEIIWICI